MIIYKASGRCFYWVHWWNKNLDKLMIITIWKQNQPYAMTIAKSAIDKSTVNMPMNDSILEALWVTNIVYKPIQAHY